MCVGAFLHLFVCTKACVEVRGVCPVPYSSTFYFPRPGVKLAAIKLPVTLCCKHYQVTGVMVPAGFLCRCWAFGFRFSCLRCKCSNPSSHHLRPSQDVLGSCLIFLQCQVLLLDRTVFNVGWGYLKIAIKAYSSYRSCQRVPIVSVEGSLIRAEENGWGEQLFREARGSQGRGWHYSLSVEILSLRSHLYVCVCDVYVYMYLCGYVQMCSYTHVWNQKLRLSDHPP